MTKQPFVFFAFCVLFLLCAGGRAGINRQFATQRHASNLRYAGLSNAGIAIPDDITGALINPSLVHTWHFNHQTRYSAAAAFERDSLFGRYIVSSGASIYINEKTTLGTLYRNLKNSDDNIQNEFLLCVAGRLFDKSLTQGAVNIGMNVRLENMSWKSGLDSLRLVRKVFDESGHIIPDSTVEETYASPLAHHFDKDRRLLFDLGFFQDNVLQNLDFGLTLHNLIGYVWHADKPLLRHTADTTFDTTATDTLPTSLIDSSYYLAKWEDSRGPNHKVYKRMSVGVAYRASLMQDKASILIPFDLEFIGIFDKNQVMKLGLRTGLEAWFGSLLCLRFGYALSPGTIAGEPGTLSLKSKNIFSGGFGVRFDHVSFNAFIQMHNWGIGSTIAF